MVTENHVRLLLMLVNSEKLLKTAANCLYQMTFSHTWRP